MNAIVNTNIRIFTAREIQILELLYIGKSNYEIGKILGISPLTVKNHVQKLLRVLPAANRQHAVYVAIQKGLLPFPGSTERPRSVVNRLEICLDGKEELVVEDISLEPATCLVTYQGKTVKAWRKTFLLLLYFLEHPNRVHTRQHLMDRIWGETSALNEQRVDVYVRRVRRLLEMLDVKFLRIGTIVKQGYFLTRTTARTSKDTCDHS